MEETEKKKILNYVDEKKTVEKVRGLLKIPSYSGKETEKAEYLVSAMKQLGLEAYLQEVEPRRCNAIGKLKGTGGGPTLIFNGHIDHNMVVDGWSQSPFDAVVRDGWLYGFVHMQSANGAYLEAVEALVNSGRIMKGDIMLQFVVGELQGGLGTKKAIKEGLLGDYYVIGEPSNLSIITQHSGHLLVKVNTLGRSKHFAARLPPGQKGVSAIEQMVRVIQAMGKSHTQVTPGGWLSFEPKEDWLGWPQFNVGVVRGGIGRDYQDWRPALLPDFCSIVIDFRTLPGQNAETVTSDLIRLLERLKTEDKDFQYEIERLKNQEFPEEGFEDPRDTPVFNEVFQAHRSVTGKPPQVNGEFPKVTDATHLSRAGMKGVIYGPAGRFTSCPDERVEVQEIITAAKSYALAAAGIVG